jgi:hypothetical protein
MERSSNKRAGNNPADLVVAFLAVIPAGNLLLGQPSQP